MKFETKKKVPVTSVRISKKKDVIVGESEFMSHDVTNLATRFFHNNKEEAKRFLFFLSNDKTFHVAKNCFDISSFYSHLDHANLWHKREILVEIVMLRHQETWDFLGWWRSVDGEELITNWIVEALKVFFYILGSFKYLKALKYSVLL